MDSERLLDGRLKLRHLVMFVAIAEQGSALGAADALHLTQPGVTRALRELETALGQTLFERGTRGMSITVEGETFLAHARAIIGQVRQASRHLQEVSAAEVGRLNVGTHLGGADRLLPRAIRRLKSTRPRLVVEIVEALPERLIQLLLDGTLDLVIGRVDIAPDDPRLRQIRLLHEQIPLVVRSRHPALDKPAMGLAALREFPWIFPNLETRAGRAMLTAFSDRGLELPEDRIISSSLSTPRALILESDAVAVLPLHVAMSDSRLRVLPCPDLALARTVGAQFPADRPLTRAADALLGCLREEAVALEALMDDQPGSAPD
ncbi:LysR substrate-binding domain-containing protein [Saccharopolyspora shandongensis]|uniref:LysR substrate-binding domain-containing protein n=1 Tax=Saccharopolyspora shandongensis TaxID=418495 RepID=UPI0033ED032C